MRRGLAAALLAGAAWLSACASEPPEEPASRTAAAAPRRADCVASVRLVNGSTRAVQRLFIKDPALTSWGRDRLGLNVLAPGGSVSVPTDGPGHFDVRIIWADGNNSELRRVNICTTPTVTVGNFGLNAR